MRLEDANNMHPLIGTSRKDPKSICVILPCMEDCFFRVILNETINELAALKPLSAIDPSAHGAPGAGGSAGDGSDVGRNYKCRFAFLQFLNLTDNLLSILSYDSFHIVDLYICGNCRIIGSFS